MINDFRTLRGVWDFYGLWWNYVSIPGYSKEAQKDRENTARQYWHKYVMQEREKALRNAD